MPDFAESWLWGLSKKITSQIAIGWMRIVSTIVLILKLPISFSHNKIFIFILKDDVTFGWLYWSCQTILEFILSCIICQALYNIKYNVKKIGKPISFPVILYLEIKYLEIKVFLSQVNKVCSFTGGDNRKLFDENRPIL
jgi:hypothetical protein